MTFNIAKELDRRRRKRVELRSQAQDSVNYQAQIRKQVDILRHKAEVERLQAALINHRTHNPFMVKERLRLMQQVL